LPSCTNCRITVDVIVLVLLPMRKLSSIDIGTFLPISLVPKVADQSPWSRDRIRMIAPGITLSFMTWGILVCNDAAYVGCLPVVELVAGEDLSFDDPHDASTNMAATTTTALLFARPTLSPSSGSEAPDVWASSTVIPITGRRRARPGTGWPRPLAVEVDP